MTLGREASGCGEHTSTRGKINGGWILLSKKDHKMEECGTLLLKGALEMLKLHSGST